MPGNTVSFMQPGAILAPDLSVEQAKLQRQYDLAQALRQMSLQNDVPQKGVMSWTQGAAKLAEALAARSMTRRADDKQLALNRAYAERLGPMFGRKGGAGTDGTAPSPGSPANGTQMPGIVSGYGGGTFDAQGHQVTPSGRAGDPMPNADASTGSTFDRAFSPDAMSAIQNGQPVPSVAQSSGIPATNGPPQGMPPVTDQGSVVPQSPQGSPQPSQSASPGSQQQTQSWEPGPWSLTGDPQQDMAMWAGDQGEYMKQVIASHAPVDTAKLVQQAQAAMSRGDIATATALLGKVQHDNYIAPVNARGNSWTTDPMTGNRTYNPSLPEGSTPLYDENHNVVAVRLLDGTTQAVAAVQGAKTAGQNANEPIAGYDANGNPVFGSKLDAAHGGNPNFRPGPPLGASAAADVVGKQSAAGFQAISDAAADVPNRVLALKQMQTLVNDPKTILGPGSANAAKVKGFIGTLSQSLGLDFTPASVTNAAEFGKWASQYSARTAQEMGLNGSDARLALTIHATPNGEMTPQALRAIIPQMIGFENAKSGMAVAAQAWQQQHGAMSLGQFRNSWNQTYDPRIYTWLAEGSVQQNMAKLKKDNPADYQALVRKATTLGNMGALPR